MSPKIEPITGPIDLGEGPYWDSVNQCLYFIDIPNSGIHKYDTRTSVHTSARVGNEPVSVIFPIKGKSNGFVVSYGNDLASIEWNGTSEQVEHFEKIVEIDDRQTNRLNDGKIGPDGEVIIGSMARVVPQYKHDRQGSLYYYKNGVVNELFGDVGISNGLAWSSDARKLFYADTLRYEVTCYDYDPSVDSVLTNGRTAFCFEATNTYGCPDGLTIDVNDKLWVANYQGAEVLHIDPETGKLLDRIKMPSAHITSVVFGGPNLDELYVTSAYVNTFGDENDGHTHTGCVFRITDVGVKGVENSPIVL